MKRLTVFVCLCVLFASIPVNAGRNDLRENSRSTGSVTRSKVARSPRSTAQSPEANLPGAAHKALVARAGSYTTKTSFIASPGAKPVETTGSATLRSAAEGRFLMEENTGILFGQPTNGVRLWGYNNGTKKYEASWVYAGSTAILLLTGTSSDNGTVINWEGSFQDPQGGKVTMRARTRNIDANRFSIELLNKATDGTEFVMLETTYTRKP